MAHPSSVVHGELKQWPTKERMSEILRHSGMRVTVQRYSVRIDDCSHFVFQEYGHDMGEPSIDADAESTEEMLSDAQRVSTALSHAGIVHRFEVYDEHDTIAGYFHYEWPQTNSD
jgi:hypothetical protein